MSLSKYNRKRDFKATPEPEGKVEETRSFRFVVQRHDATRLHYDFRLELGGVLKSWAVPKGPSMNPADKRLAVMVEDHPVSYIDFEGVIPKGNYGAGIVMVWDSGNYFPINEKSEKITESKALANLKKGELKIFMNGKHLQGEFVLVQLKSSEDKKNFLLIKHRDQYAVNDSYDSEDYVPKAKLKKAKSGKSA